MHRSRGAGVVPARRRPRTAPDGALVTGASNPPHARPNASCRVDSRRQRRGIGHPIPSVIRMHRRARPTAGTRRGFHPPRPLSIAAFTHRDEARARSCRRARSTLSRNTDGRLVALVRDAGRAERGLQREPAGGVGVEAHRLAGRLHDLHEQEIVRGAAARQRGDPRRAALRRPTQMVMPTACRMASARSLWPASTFARWRRARSRRSRPAPGLFGMVRTIAMSPPAQRLMSASRTPAAMDTMSGACSASAGARSLHHRVHDLRLHRQHYRGAARRHLAIVGAGVDAELPDEGRRASGCPGRRPRSSRGASRSRRALR